MRYFIIGDIHGCYEELEALLDKAGPTHDDHIIAIGDIVNRGPHNRRAFDFFRHARTPNIRAVMGNHERKHLRAYHGEIAPPVSVLVTRWQLGSGYYDAIHWMESLPRFIDLPDALLVHAYFEPGVPVEQQEDRIIVGSMGGEQYLERSYRRPWYELYDGEKPLIVGHRDWSGERRPFVYKKRVYGIDTRCVYGGSLTGLWLPEFEFVSVPAQRDHYAAFRERYLEEGE